MQEECRIYAAFRVSQLTIFQKRREEEGYGVQA